MGVVLRIEVVRKFRNKSGGGVINKRVYQIEEKESGKA